MPEGPEASYITKFIKKEFIGKKLTQVTILKGRYINHGLPEHYKEFIDALPLIVTNVEKKGKVIFIYFANTQDTQNWCIISKLGMTGWWYSKEKPAWRSEVKSLTFDFQNGHQLIYSDPRSYGTLTFTKDQQLIQAELDQIAPDIMAKTTTIKVFENNAQTQIQKKPHMPIEELLSDQKLLISGIGNYLKSEILYTCKIAPMREIGSISKADWKLLYKNARKISTKMTKALSSKNIEAYESSMNVYMKKQDPLGHKVETYSNKHGRTVHWVREVQK
jgi:DNA-formamidopyrimidine glycosylase